MTSPVKPNQVIVLKRPGETPERVHLNAELKSGGAGSVYSIKDDVGRVIKIYHTETLISEGTTYQEKIECMLVNMPNVSEITSSGRAVVQLAWPLASAYSIHGEFLGFAMPMVDMQLTTELEYILLPKQAKKEGLHHNLGTVVSLAHNLAAIVSSIHVLSHAIVDLKPVNLKFYKNVYYVSVLDCDGFYINLPGKASSAPQVTPDYLAPEFHNSPITIPEHQDRFALAVIVFQLLNFGIHPYAGVPAKRVNIPSDTEGKIKAGLYSYGIVPHKKVSPLPGSAHEAFPLELRSLFDRAFGRSPADRPKAKEWAETLKLFAEKSKGLLEICTEKHLHFKDMPCGTCSRDQFIARASKPIGSHSSAPSGHSISSSTPHNSAQSATHTQSARTASQSSVQQHSASPTLGQSSTPSSFKPGEFAWTVLQKILYGASFITFFITLALIATPVGWAVLVASLIAVYFIGIKFWITFLVISIVLSLGNESWEDRDLHGIKRVLLSLAGGAIWTGLIFGGILTYVLLPFLWIRISLYISIGLVVLLVTYIAFVDCSGEKCPKCKACVKYPFSRVLISSYYRYETKSGQPDMRYTYNPLTNEYRYSYRCEKKNCNNEFTIDSTNFIEVR